MPILAKFKCNQVNRFVGGETAVLNPVTSGSSENKSFSMYTPSGEFTLTITNPDALGYFTPGLEYYVNIAEAVNAS